MRSHWLAMSLRRFARRRSKTEGGLKRASYAFYGDRCLIAQCLKQVPSHDEQEYCCIRMLPFNQRWLKSPLTAGRIVPQKAKMRFEQCAKVEEAISLSRSRLSELLKPCTTTAFHVKTKYRWGCDRFDAKFLGPLAYDQCGPDFLLNDQHTTFKHRLKIPQARN